MSELRIGVVVVVAIAAIGACSSSRSQPAPTPSPVTPAPGPAPATIPNSIETIVADMTLPHEGAPHGVPTSYDWAIGPRIGYGNKAGAFHALIAWGQLYEDAAGNPAANTRVAIKDIRAYVLSRKTGGWRLVSSTTAVEGGAYREDFAGDVNRPADVRNETDGSISVTAGGGYNYHFWPTSGRVSIDPDDVGGVFTTVQARLVVAEPARADDRAQARYLLCMGADYWTTLDASWSNFTTNGDVGIGRFKYVRPDWQSFNMISLDADSVRRTPPPF